MAEYYRWTEAKKAVCLHNAIRGEAANALGAAESKSWTYNKLIAHMELRHGRNKSYGDVVIELMSHSRRAGQPLSAWHDQVINIVNTANLTGEQEKMTAFFGFIYGLRMNQTLFNKVLSRVRNSTISEAFDQATAWERDNGSRAAHLNLPTQLMAAQVNMVTAAENEPKRCDVIANPGLALVNAVKTQNAKSDEPMSGVVNTVVSQIQAMGDRIDKRFDKLDGRVSALEKNTQGRGGYRGGRNNYQGDRRNNDRRGPGDYNNGYRGNRDNDRPMEQNNAPRENQNEGRNDRNGNYRPNGYRGNNFRPRGRGGFRGRGGYNQSRQEQRAPDGAREQADSFRQNFNGAADAANANAENNSDLYASRSVPQE